jgi:HD-GYP domain-containing protein (c-di-GMP phosphodiesterase class II)
MMTWLSRRLSFGLSRSFENYYYYHPVNVSILSAALGKRIGFERVHLRNLAMEQPFSMISEKL